LFPSRVAPKPPILGAMIDDRLIHAPSIGFFIMSDQTLATVYNTPISGANNTNIIGGEHTHIHPEKRSIARPTIDRKGSETFVGRESQLEELHQLLAEESQVAIAAATSGMGGVGKTELAVQYALRYDGEYPAGVWWLSGRDIVGQVLSYAVRMGLPETGTSSSEVQKVQECYAFWKQGIAGRRLVIVDDVVTAADYAAVRPFLPTGGEFRVVLTTRERLQMRRLDLGVFTLPESLGLLREIVGTERVDRELSLAEKLCEWLGNLPLAIELVGRYLAATSRTTIATLLERLKGQKLAARALLRGQPMTTTHESLAAAFEVSWLALEDRPKAQELGAFLSLFGLAAIPWVAVEGCLSEWEEEERDEAWDALVNLHLVGTDEQLHPMLREFLAVKLDEMPDCEAARERYVEVMLSASQKWCKQTMNREQVADVALWVPHWVDLTERRSVEVFGESIGNVATNLGLFYYAQGLFEPGFEWSERALAISEKQLGPDHPQTAGSLNNLAGLYRSMGRYESAEPLHLRALAISEKQLGPDHPQTAGSLNNLAELYRSMGRYESAEPLYFRALAISEKQLGLDHPSTGTSLNNLALLYRSMGRYESAEPLFLRALAIREKQLGPDHPDTGTSLNNLALLYQSMERYESAEPLFLRALAIREKQLGPDHPDTAGSLNNLALLYQSMERYESVEPLFLRALAIREKQLGPDHPDTAGSLNNLALLYQSMERYESAEPLFLRALAIDSAVLGEDHPDTAIDYWNLAGLYTELDRYEEAETLYHKAVKVFLDRLPQDHPYVEGTFNGLVVLIATAHTNSQADRLSDHPMTQAILQQVRSAD
jgi:tetratricopeptide (TPR) repeat protein